MVWQKEIDELKHRWELGKQMGGDKAIDKQHSRGRLTIRERIDLLFDSDSFQEVEWFVGRVEYDEHDELKAFTPDRTAIGYGKINGRLVCFRGDDTTIPITEHAYGSKTAVYIEEEAASLRMGYVIDEGAPSASRITSLRLLDLYYLSTIVSKDSGGIWTSQYPGEVDHP